MSRHTAPLMSWDLEALGVPFDERPPYIRAIDRALGRKLEVVATEMFGDEFDKARRINISRWCDYGYHSQCPGMTRAGLKCICRECLHV